MSAGMIDLLLIKLVNAAESAEGEALLTAFDQNLSERTGTNGTAVENEQGVILCLNEHADGGLLVMKD